MKLSMMSCTMTREAGVGPEECVLEAAKLKFDGIDWITTCGRAPEELRKMSHDAGLPVVCHTFFPHKLVKQESGWLDDIKQSIDDAVAMEAPMVMIPTLQSQDMPRDAFRRFWIQHLKQIVKLTDDAGLVLAIENFPGKDSAFVTADDYLEAKAEIPQLKLTYDSGNAASGEDPVASFLKCADDVVHAHYKDWYIRDDNADGYREMLDGKFYKPALIGEGDVPTEVVWNAMCDYGYKGYINIEYEGYDVDAWEAVRRVVEYLKSL